MGSRVFPLRAAAQRLPFVENVEAPSRERWGPFRWTSRQGHAVGGLLTHEAGNSWVSQRLRVVRGFRLLGPVGLVGMVAWAALVQGASEADAAPKVGPDRFSARLEAYDSAARELGWSEWGSAEEGRGPFHVVVRAAPDRAVLGILLPPETPPVRANAWLQRLADAMGWRGAALYSAVTPAYVGTRAVVMEAVRPERPGQSRLAISLTRLREAVRAETGGPVLLMVRLAGAELRSVRPEPWKRGRLKEGEFLLYDLGRLPSPVAGTLEMRYGLSLRWAAMVGAAVALWTLAPLGVLRLMLGCMLRRMAREGVRAVAETAVARQALTTYRRAQRGAMLGSAVGMVGTLAALGPAHLLYAAGSELAFLLPTLLLLPVAGVGLAGRLVGLSLERKAWPRPGEWSWYQTASLELLAAGALLAYLALSGFLLARRQPADLSGRAAVERGVIGNRMNQEARALY